MARIAEEKYRELELEDSEAEKAAKPKHPPREKRPTKRQMRRDKETRWQKDE